MPNVGADEAPPWPWRGWGQRLLVAAGWSGVGIGVVTVVVRWLGASWQPLIVLAAFAPFALVAPLVGGTLLVIRRRWLPAALAVVVLVVGAGVEVPLFVGSSRFSGGVALILLQANLRIGGADAGDIVDRVRTEHVDVVTVEELTPAELGALHVAGLDAVLGHHLVAPDPGGAGSGIWSRLPLSAMRKHDGFRFEVLSASVAVAGAIPVSVFAVHLLPPWPYPSSTWLAELKRLHVLLTATAPGAVIAGGDFNATLDHAQFRALLGNGFVDAGERVGAGLTPTYPTDRSFPPLLTLDHVLCREAGATSLRTVALPGSDHRGLLVHLTTPQIAIPQRAIAHSAGAVSGRAGAPSHTPRAARRR